MPPRKRNKIRVRATLHAAERWEERADRSKKKLDNLMTAALHDQLGAGVPVVNGQPVLRLSAERLGLEEDLLAPLELPGLDGVWYARTVKPLNEPKEAG